MNRFKVKIIIGTLITLGILAAIGGGIFIISGRYDIAARNPHMAIMRIVLLTTKDFSVRFHAKSLEEPELNDADLIRHGFSLYQKNCVACHGAPGANRDRMGIGLNPNPPPLENISTIFKPKEIAWIIANGLKMAGMPAFGIGKEPKDLWGITAFVVRMNTMSPEDYRLMDAEVNLQKKVDVQWTAPDQEWGQLEKGNKEKGRASLKYHGCVSCHVIPGVEGAHGMSGPTLAGWAKRHYLAGKLVNTPKNLIPWIMNPQSIKPGTAMTNLKVTEEEAIDMAVYLYSLDDED